MKPRFKILLSVLVIVSSLTTALVIRAQNWIGPKEAPITNTPIQRADGSIVKNFSQLGGDDLGDHTAIYDLDMSQYAILGIAGTSDNRAAVHVSSTAGGIGVSISSSGAPGIWAENNSSLATLFINNNNSSGYALKANGSEGVGSIGALIYGQVVLRNADRLIIGTNGNNSLGISDPGAGNEATLPLYWGNMLICDPAQPNCGFATVGSETADNLGFTDPHTATKNLDMSFYNIFGIGSNSGAAALEVSSEGLGGGVLVHRSDGATMNGLRITVLGETTSTDPVDAGIYGLHTNVGPGLKAVTESSSDPSAMILGRLNLAASTDNIIFQASSNALGLQAETSPATNNLYWGNQLICQADQPNCGWALSPGSAYWKQGSYAPNIYYDDGNVGIGTNLPLYPLEVTDIAEASVASLGALSASTVSTAGNIYVAQDANINGAAQANNNGVFTEGKISVSSDGIVINGVTLTEAELQAAIAACQLDGICS